MKMARRAPLWKPGVVFLCVCAYLAAAYLLEDRAGRMVFAFSILPVAAAGWLFGVFGGILSGILALFLNIALVYFFKVSAVRVVFDAQFILGSIILILTGALAGWIRDEFVKVKKTERLLRARERYLSLLNKITHTIIASPGFDIPMRQLAQDLAALLDADDCYITRWDAEKNLTIPVASTALLDPPFETIEVQPHHKTLTESAFEANGVIVVEDLANSPFISPDIAARIPARSTLCVPLIVGEARIGAIIVAHREPHAFTEDEKRNASQAGEQIALALLNVRRGEEIKKQLLESDALSRIARALSQSERIGLANVLELIAASAKELIPGANQVVIHSLDSENDMLTPEAAIGYENPHEGRAKMRLGEGVAGQAVVNRETLNITDVLTDPRFLNRGAPVQFRSLMVTPIISGDRILGTISVQSGEPFAFTSNEKRLLHTLGTQAAIAIDNARLLESIQQALRETNALYRISRGLLALDSDELLDDAVDLLEKNFGYHLVKVYVMDPHTREFILKASSGETRSALEERNLRLKPGAGIVGHVAETRKPFFTNDVESVIFYEKNPLSLRVKSEMAVPIQAGDQLLGILDIQQQESITFAPRDLQVVSAVADQLAASLQKADLYESLQQSLRHEKSIRNQLVQNERLAIMGRLLASVSHELNNPLQAIQNALFLLREEKGISLQGMKDLEIVLAESERMAGMIERLRNTYRPTQEEDLQPTDINDIIEDVYALLANHLKKSSVAFEFHPDPALPAVQAVPDQIRQVALNLLMNSVEAMPDGGKLTVETFHLRETREAMFSVSDTGAGIPSAILPLIFDPFVTNKKRGTGIGLTISHDIVVKHGGRISAENNPGGFGASFKVRLPIRAATEGA